MVGRDTDGYYAREWKGKPGFLFVVPGAELGDIQPDEDDVGWMFSLLSPASWIKGDPYDTKYMEDSHRRLANALRDDPRRAGYFRHVLDGALTDNQKRHIRDGMYAYFSAGGKRAMRYLSDADKLWLVTHGCHVANAGTVTPSQAWRFDRGAVGRIARDGSNFFEVAQRVA